MQNVASSGASARRALWRYNYQILTGAGTWVLFLPIAASQLVTLWMMPMRTEFNQVAATRIAELLAPVLGAWLTAHCLAPEYRSGIGAVLACKPISMGQVVAVRVVLAMLTALGLVAVTLLVCSVAVRPIDPWRPLLASLPSLWFLSLLALTFATLFRNSLAGFAVAAAVWALDLAVGYGIHPLLSAQGYTASLEEEALATLWLPGKLTLLALGALLLLLQPRLLQRVCRPVERTDLRGMLLAAVALITLYTVTGAMIMVGYAYANRGSILPSDVLWLRRQLRAYDPLPVARFFGPAFAAYVADPPSVQGEGGSLNARVQELQKALKAYPDSIWADSIAYSLALERDRAEENAPADDFFAVADRHPASPFAPKALAALLRSESPGIGAEERLRAAQLLLSDYRRSLEVEKAAEYLLQGYPDEITPGEMLTAAQAAAAAGPRYRRPDWLVVIAEIQLDEGRAREAAAAAREARAAGRALLEEARRTGLIESNLGPHLARISQAVARAEQILAGEG